MGGRIVAIHIAGMARAPMIPKCEVQLVAGIGIEGDRYHVGKGTFSDWPRDHELTLIESEVIADVLGEYKIDLRGGGSRRNITTIGIRLNDLIGCRFRIGDVLCEGTRRCDPCAHLEIATKVGGLARLLAGRGGLRARILENGPIRVGDPIDVVGELK